MIALLFLLGLAVGCFSVGMAEGGAPEWAALIVAGAGGALMCQALFVLIKLWGRP